jgi:hypothetical protein
MSLRKESQTRVERLYEQRLKALKLALEEAAQDPSPENMLMVVFWSLRLGDEQTASKWLKIEDFVLTTLNPKPRPVTPD